MLQDSSTSATGTPRIALVTGGLKLGGSTTFLCNFAGELVRRGIAVEVLSFERETPLASDFSQNNVKVLCQDEGKTIFEDRLEMVLRELRRFNPTAVVSTLGATSFEVLRYLPQGIMRLGAVQSDDPLVYAMVRCYAGQVDLMAAVSRAIKEKLEAMPEFARVPAAYLPYGVPMPKDPALRTIRTNGPLRILYLGRLIREQKRVQLFPDILGRLKESGIPFHWTIAGDGPDQDFLRDSMKNGTADQTISFAGKVSYSEVPKLLAEHDVFLLASDYEGLPLSLLEAMGAGMVPVVSDLPSGIREVVDEKTGKRVPPDKVHGYAEAIVWLHEHRAELGRFSSAAQEKVAREYSVGAMSDRWLSLLGKGSVKVEWPNDWSIKRPLTSTDRIRFTAPARVLRRWLIRLKR